MMLLEPAGILERPCPDREIPSLGDGVATPIRIVLVASACETFETIVDDGAPQFEIVDVREEPRPLDDLFRRIIDAEMPRRKRREERVLSHGRVPS